MEFSSFHQAVDCRLLEKKQSDVLVNLNPENLSHSGKNHFSMWTAGSAYCASSLSCACSLPLSPSFLCLSLFPTPCHTPSLSHGALLSSAQPSSHPASIQEFSISQETVWESGAQTVSQVPTVGTCRVLNLQWSE